MATSAASGAVIRSQLRTGLDIVISGSLELIVQLVTRSIVRPSSRILLLTEPLLDMAIGTGDLSGLSLRVMLAESDDRKL
jgi:hypothetical protein